MKHHTPRCPVSPPAASSPVGSEATPVLEVDYEAFASYLDDAALSEDEKRQFLQALWSIIVDFVALGFGVHPVQQAQNACGQLSENPAALRFPDLDTLSWTDPSTTHSAAPLAAAFTGPATPEESATEGGPHDAA